MKNSSMNTHMGNITIDKEVIAQYAGTVAMECFGIVGMAGFNVRDGIVKLLKKENFTRGISVSLKNDKLMLEFHVIIAYGVNIRALSSNLIESVKYKVEEFTGIEVAKINIFVEGVRVID
ncbi:MAG: Asp23/Gls24 family envelope stress response protein [Lachnospiraceae bacterium]|nr:Asp23/Gls24 family envelope stress response protein [Lachnospiraceae bacterium]